MGLMTLIARKFNPDKHQQSQPRAPPYERKISAKSPVRLVQTVSPSGTASAPGGSRSSTPAPRERQARETALSSLSQSSSPEGAAPAPVILGFRGDDLPSRPATASSRRQADARWASSVSLGLPASPKPSRFSHLATLRSRSSLLKPDKPETAAGPSRPDSHQAQNPIAGKTIAASIRTTGSIRTHVDLLDAQSEFQSADFYSRIKASGARDFGEDVADRNIGQNGCNLDSHLVQKFYAGHAGSSGLPSLVARNRASSQSTFSGEDDDSFQGGRGRVTKQASLDQALWSKPPTVLNPSRSALFRSQSPSPAEAGATLSKKRQTFSVRPAYSTPSLDELEEIQSLQRLQDRQRKRASLREPGDDEAQLGPVWRAASPAPGHGPPAAALTDSPRRAAARPATASGLARRLSNSSRRSDAVMSAFQSPNEGPAVGVVNTQSVLSPQPASSHHLSATLPGSAPTASNRRTSAMHSTHAVKHADWPDDPSDRDSAPSPFIKKHRSHSQHQGSASDYPRARGVATPCPLSQAGEVAEEQVIGRLSSNRRWSMTSTAPTTSSSSSATYPRPHSRHTASTSIDLSAPALSSTIDSHLLSINGDLASQLALKMPYSGSGLKQSPETLHMPPFGMSEYVSSDDDSFVGEKTKPRKCEEDLLFSDGYGAHGIQLPGLEDAFAAPEPVILKQRPSSRTSVSKQPRGEDPRLFADFSYSLDNMGVGRDAREYILSPERSATRRQQRQQRRSSGSNGMTDTMSRSSDSKEAGPNRRASESPVETKRLSALGIDGGGFSNSNSSSHRHHPYMSHFRLGGSNVGEQVIEEEKLDKVNVAAAVRLRKEAKSRRRESMMSMATAASPDRVHSQVKTISIESRHKGSPSSSSSGSSSSADEANDRPAGNLTIIAGQHSFDSMKAPGLVPAACVQVEVAE